MSREDRIRDAVDRFVARVRQDTDARLQDLATELLQVARGDMRTSRVDIERAAVEVARAAASSGSDSGREFITNSIAAMRRMDAATSLRGVLDRLADCAITAVPRLAVLVMEGTKLRTYRQHGFESERLPVDVSLDSAPVLAAVVQTGQPATVPASIGRPDPRVPAFLWVPPGGLGLLSPLSVDRHVVAVVCAEGSGRPEGDAREPVWIEEIELLVRYGAARLEAVTSQRTVEVLSKS
jgi:hypothetical protein